MNAAFTAALQKAREEGPEAMKALAENHLSLVGTMVRRFPSSASAHEELYQQGVIGLMKALKRYDPAKGTAFSTYAAAFIIGEMRMLQRQDAPIHISRTEKALRLRIRQQTMLLTSRLQREPTVDELAAALRMDAAELMLHMDEITVSYIDAQSPGHTVIADMAPDPENLETRIELRDILSRLPAMDRKLLLLRHRFGLSQTEAGLRLGMSQMQVSRREKRIRQLLKRALTD